MGKRRNIKRTDCSNSPLEKQVGKRRKIKGSSISDTVISESNITMDKESITCFSCLPDNVMTHIFYFLPMKETIGTCMLSKNLRHLWTSLPNLEFKDCAGMRTSENVREVVQNFNKFLEHHDGPIRSCQLILSSRCYVSYFGRWVNLLIEKGVEELDLDLPENVNEQIELPSCLFSSKTLKVLKLRSCVLRPPGFSGSHTLRKLVLVDMSLSDDLVRSLLSQCIGLRNLTFQNCTNFKSVKVSDSNTLLECLKVENCPSLIEVDAPNIPNLYLCGKKIQFLLKGFPEAVNVEISRYSSVCVNQQEATSLKYKVLAKLVNVQSISLLGWAFKCFAAGRFHEDNALSSSYLKLRKLELELSSWNVKELKGMLCLLRSCPSAERLVLWMNEEIAGEDEYENHYRNYEDEFDGVDEYYGEEEEEEECGLWYGCLSNSLAWIEIYNFSGTNTDLKLVKFLLKNAKWLRSMTINPVKEMDPRQQLGFTNLFKRLNKPCIDTKIVIKEVKSEA